MSVIVSDPGKRLALRFNNLMFGLFGFWLSLLVMFWLRASGILLSFGAAPLATNAAVWFAASLAIAIVTAKLPRSFYRPRAFELDGSFYRAIGIRGFRAIITDGDMINRFVRRRYPGYRVHQGRDALTLALESGVKSERAHHVLFWFGLGTAICAGVGGWPGWAITISLGNVVGNLYPMLLQRYTRGRIWRVRRELAQRVLEVGNA